MSTSWNEFREGAERFIDKLSEEAVRVGDAAGMQLKLQNCKNRLEKEYAVLGKLTYAKPNGRSDNTEDIDASLKRISELRALKRELEIAIEDAKAEKEAQKKAENVANGIK